MDFKTSFQKLKIEEQREKDQQKIKSIEKQKYREGKIIFLLKLYC